MPSYLILFIMFHRKDVRFHASCIQCLSFLKIVYIKPIFLSRVKPSNFEVKPLQMSFGVCINPHKKVVVMFLDLIYCIEVAAFEQRIEF